MKYVPLRGKSHSLMSQHLPLHSLETENIILQPLDHRVFHSYVLETPGTDLPELSADEGDSEPYENFSEETSTFNDEPLSPRPLDPKRGRHCKFRSHQARHATHVNSGLAASSHATPYGPAQNDERAIYSNQDPDRDRKNKPLPLAPDDRSSMELVPRTESTARNYCIDEALTLPSSKDDRYSMSVYSMTLQNAAKKDQPSAKSSNAVKELATSENYGTSDHRSKSALLTFSEHKKDTGQNIKSQCRVRRVKSVPRIVDPSQTGKKLLHVLKGGMRTHVGSGRKSQTGDASTPCPALYLQPSTLERMNELHERRLLYTFFGFDLMSQLHPLNDARLQQIQHYLTTQPHPDSVIKEERYPLVCCVWLRNFIVASPHKLDFDRGRLRGLRLEDKSTQNVHRGFGLLWDFLEACGPNVRYQACAMGLRKAKKQDAQLKWFQVCTVPSGVYVHPPSVSLEGSS